MATETKNIVVGGAKVYVASAVPDEAVITGAAGGFIGNVSYNAGAGSSGASGAPGTLPLVTKSIVDSASATRGLLGYLTAYSGEEVGFTTDGIDLEIAPEFSDVEVDQLLDAAIIFKTGQKVSFKTSFAEASLKNLARAVGRPDTDVTQTGATGAANTRNTFGLRAGALGDFPSERRIIAVANGPRVGAVTGSERIFEAFRAISVESVGVAIKRNEATVFPVSFRCLPASGGAYMKIADRLYG
jgi:hypothetical protein